MNHPAQEMNDAIDPAARLADVQARIRAAAEAQGRSIDHIALVAVAKKHDAARIRPVIAAGHRIFGENRVQEAAAKWPALREAADGIELHLIGPLQTNKVKDACALFDVIQTLDRPKLARALADHAEKAGDLPRLFVQINTGEETQKSGLLPTEADGFLEACRAEFGLTVEGLMCIPPAHEEAALHFALLREIARRNGIEKLSMGMSGDYEKAIAFGATHVRVGEAIFGPRPAS